jgi:hypothetical protein
MKTTIFKNRRHELRPLRRHNSGLDRKGTWVRKASVSFAERQARLLYDPKPFRMLIQRPGFRVVARQAADEDAR